MTTKESPRGSGALRPLQARERRAAGMVKEGAGMPEAPSFAASRGAFAVLPAEFFK